MKFQRSQIIRHDFAGIDPATGLPHTTATIAQIGVDDLLFGDGTTHNVLQADGSLAAVPSVVLPAAYNENALFPIQIHDNRQIYLSVNIRALGGAALTGITAVIEFNDPDYPSYWYPSREGVDRTAGFAANEFTLLGANSWCVASRVEHMQNTLARVRFHAAAGAADQNTFILCSFHLDGGNSALTNVLR